MYIARNFYAILLGHIDFLHILARFVQYFPVLVLFCSFCEINYSKIREITQISKIIVFVSKIKVFMSFFILLLQTKNGGWPFQKYPTSSLTY